MSDYGFRDEGTIAEYLVEYEALKVSVGYLEERLETIDSILRNYHNFAIGRDRLVNVVG
jgi:hypothetical protein